MTQILSLVREPPEVVASAEITTVELAVAQLLDGRDLDRTQAEAVFGTIVRGGLPDPLMAAVFVALRVRGETSEELIGAASALRAAARSFPSPSYVFADSCG